MEPFVDFRTELIFIIHLVISTLLGGFIGYDRERDGSNAGIRTYAAVCLGATLFTLVSTHLDGDSGTPSRIIATIVTGIGFLGAGIIYKSDTSNNVQGLTTAATVWATAAVGVAVALNMFIVALSAAIIIYWLLSLQRRRWYLKWKKKIKDEDELANTPKD